MMKTYKKLFICALSVLGAGCLSLGLVCNSNVMASAETPQLAASLAMQNGASVRINKTESYEDNGIRFSALISNEEYETVRRMDNAAFGMFIMPESYLTRFGDLTAENVNMGGVYDWTENNSNEYFYGGDEIQAESHRIIALTYSELPEYKYDADYKVIHGSVVEIKDENLDMNYVGRGFIRYEVDGFYFYEMADWYDGYVANNVRSVTYVAKKAIADKASNLDGSQKDALNNAYMAKSLALQGYTAITTAEEFAGMSANGKYYLANDITVSSAYANEFTGIFNGNGKTITANGTSAFTTFAGTLSNVSVKTNAAVIASLKGGLVDGITVNYTYSDSAKSAIAASSARTARVENCIVYTDNNSTLFVPEQGAFVSNCVKTTDSSVVYSEISFVGAEGTVKKFMKNGTAVHEKYIYGAVSELAGNVTWHKEFATVDGDATYYATDYETVYDEDAAWVDLADSAVNGTESSIAAPYGYDNVYVGNQSWATASIEGYTTVRFAAKMSGYFLLSGWSIYSDANDWLNIVMEKQEDGTWTVNVYGPVYSGGAWVDSYQKTGMTATTIAEAMSFVTFGGYTTCATEVYGVEEVIELYGTEIVAQAIAGSSATTAVEAPKGFERAYEYASIPEGTAFADVDISGYSEVKFNMWLDNGYVCIIGWGAFAQNSEWGKQWVPITLTNNGSNWTVTIEAQLASSNGVLEAYPYTYTASGTKLSEVLATWFDFVSGSATIYITEIRGKAFPLYGTEIVAQALKNATVAAGEAAPQGFEKVYSQSGFAKGDFADVDISGYETVRFQMKANSWILFDGWSKYIDKRNTWLPVEMVNNGDGAWTVTVDGQTITCVNGTTLNTVLSKWYTDAGDFTIYTTEIRGIAKAGMEPSEPSEPTEPIVWGTLVDNSVLTSEYVTLDETATAPEGFEKVYSVSGVTKTNKSTVDLSNYAEIRFAVKSTKYFLISGWSIYFKESYTDWANVVMVNNGDGTWTVTIYGDVFTGSAVANPYTVTYTGTTLNTILSKWETSDATTYVTEVRGEKFPVWGEKIVESALKNTTKTTETAPIGFENVSTKTAFSTDFANVNISLYSEVRFAIKSSSWVLLGNSWATYYDHRNWVSVVLTNNNNGTWTLQWYAQAQNANGEYTSENPFTETVTGETLKELVVNHSSNASATIYVTELRGLKKDIPVVEVPEAKEEPVALEAQEDTVLWGEQVTENGVVGFAQTEAVAVPNGYNSVVAGVPATTANADGVRVGEFFKAVDISAYAEVRFAFKSSSWMLFGGWGSYVHVPNEWVSVSMKQTSAGVWAVTVYAKNAVSGMDPCVLTYNGTTLQGVLLSWYNASGETFYFTDFRGVKSVVDSSEMIEACAVTSGATLDETVSAPEGFAYAYALSGQFNNGNKSTTDLSNYSEVRFAVKSTKYFLINSWSVYFRESYNDWAPVVMVNNGDGTWTVTIYGEVYTGSAYENPYTITYTGNSLKTILSKWESSDATVYVTELRGIKSELKSDVKISNLVCTTVYNALDVTAPDGYENVYRKDGLNKGDFANVDISSYAEVNFQVKVNGWILFNGWSSMMDTRNTWLPVCLVNNGDNQWAATVNGESVPTANGSTLKEVLANWYSDYTDNGGFQMYVTELRGVHGTYEAKDIKAIAMLQSDKTTESKKAALELSKLIKEITGTELLVEYCNSVSELDSHRRYILLGTLAASAVDADALEMETGYVMQKVGNHVALYATTSDGMYNAAYGFLNAYYGLEFYTDTDKTYNVDGNPLIGSVEDVVFNPSIEYAWAIDGLLTDGANDDFNWDYVNRLGYSNLYSQIGGGSWHNFLTVVSEEKYGASGTVSQNASWFVSKTVDGQTFKTLNLASYSDAIAVAAANELAVMINATPNVDVWQLTPPDYQDSALTSDVYVTFMNKVAASLNGQISRKVNLMLLAYTATFAAPTVAFAPQTNVGFTVMAAPIGMNYYYGFDNTTFTDENGKTNAWYLEQITAWSNMAEELYIWNYSVYFDNYFVPLDTITNMQSKYQAYMNAGAKGIYDQGSSEANATDWAELKVYLKAELARNVYADVDALIEGFMTAYYGEAAAPYMLQLLNAQQAHYATIASKMNGGHMTRASLFDKACWGSNNQMLTTWYGYIQSALNVTTDATLKARIHKEGLTVRYLHEVLFTNNSLTVTTAGNSSVTDSLAQIKTDAKALGITRFAEGLGWVCDDGKIFSQDNLKEGIIDNLA